MKITNLSNKIYATGALNANQATNIAFKAKDIKNDPQFAPLNSFFQNSPQMQLKTSRYPFLKNPRTTAEIEGVLVTEYNGENQRINLTGSGNDEASAIKNLWKKNAGVPLTYNYYSGGKLNEVQTTFPKMPQQIIKQTKG